MISKNSRVRHKVAGDFGVVTGRYSFGCLGVMVEVQWDRGGPTFVVYDSLEVIPAPPKEKTILPADPAARKKIPITTGVLDYFSSALAEVARVSFQGNEQHNPGQPLHWAREKSTDQADTIVRHLLERGKLDTDGMRHSAKAAWRCLALLQLELEAEGAPVARGAKIPEAEVGK